MPIRGIRDNQIETLGTDGRYLTFSLNEQGETVWKIKRLNCFQKLIRWMGCAYENTQLKVVAAQLVKEADLPDTLKTRMYEIFDHSYLGEENPFAQKEQPRPAVDPKDAWKEGMDPKEIERIEKEAGLNKTTTKPANGKDDTAWMNDLSEDDRNAILAAAAAQDKPVVPGEEKIKTVKNKEDEWQIGLMKKEVDDILKAQAAPAPAAPGEEKIKTVKDKDDEWQIGLTQKQVDEVLKTWGVAAPAADAPVPAAAAPAPAAAAPIKAAHPPATAVDPAEAIKQPAADQVPAVPPAVAPAVAGLIDRIQKEEKSLDDVDQKVVIANLRQVIAGLKAAGIDVPTLLAARANALNEDEANTPVLPSPFAAPTTVAPTKTVPEGGEDVPVLPSPPVAPAMLNQLNRAVAGPLPPRVRIGAPTDLNDKIAGVSNKLLQTIGDKDATTPPGGALNPATETDQKEEEVATLVVHEGEQE